MTEEEMRQALVRIAQTADGETLYRWLQVEAMFVEPIDASDGALRTCHGRRSLARQLMAHMAEGIESSVGDRLVAIRRDRPAGEQPIRGARAFRSALERAASEHPDSAGTGSQPA